MGENKDDNKFSVDEKAKKQFLEELKSKNMEEKKKLEESKKEEKEDDKT